MPQKSEKKSAEGSVLPEGSSVYDFLYHDARRVGSILSQLGQFGQLLNLKHKQGSGETSTTKSTLGGTGGVPGVGSATAGGEDAHAEAYDENLESTYDPLWVNALNLYEKLDQAGLLIRNIRGARIGQFVLASGVLSVIDLQLLQQAWSTKSIKDLVTKGMPPPDQSGTQQERAAARRQFEQFKALIFDMLPILPHVVQANVSTDFGNVWATLSDEAMVTSAKALILRNGVVVPGTWHMLGILDAIASDESAPQDELLASLAFGGSPMGQAAISLQPATRSLMGRPPGTFAMTPVLIFREVSA